MLAQVGIVREQCLITNVFLDRPPENNLLAWCDSKRGVSAAYKLYLPKLREAAPEFPWPETYTWDKIKQGKYIHPKYLGELVRLKWELEQARPNIVIALGGVACWALLGKSSIEALRGACAESTLVPGLKVLPTYHPAYILRAWGDRPIALADFEKALRESASPEITRHPRQILVPENLADMEAFYSQYLTIPCNVATDIEAHVGRDITCIGFAPSPDVALVVPFTDGPGYKHYWATEEEEVAALRFVKKVLKAPHLNKVFQNGLFDIQYIIKFWRITPVTCHDDTMLGMHAIQPEFPKGLGFLGSLFTDEPAWKLMRHRAKDEMEKKDE
jgi:hypothetical protein